MLKIYLTVGIPASGKSTWAKSEVSKNPNIIRISRDDLRNMLHNYIHSDSNEKQINRIQDFILTDALKKGHDIILDACHANKKYFNETCDLIKSLNIDCTVMEKSFYVELEEALERNSKREGTAKIPDDVIKKFWKKLGGNQHKFYKPRVEILLKSKKEWEPLLQDDTLEQIFLVDLDGTIANIKHRSSPYAAEECLDDEPIIDVIKTIEALYSQGYKIIFMSGREDKFKQESSIWIDQHVKIKYGENNLLMRPTGDMRPDQIIKEELFNKHIKDNYRVVAVFDDRPKVVRMWRKIGLTVFQLNDKEF